MTGKHCQMAPSWSPQSLSPHHPISCVPPSSFVYSISWFKPSCLLPLLSLGQTCECAQVVCGNWWACFPSLDSYSSPSNFALKARLRKGVYRLPLCMVCASHTRLVVQEWCVLPILTYLHRASFSCVSYVPLGDGIPDANREGGTPSHLCALLPLPHLPPFAHFLHGAPIRCCEHHLSVKLPFSQTSLVAMAHESHRAPLWGTFTLRIHLMRLTYTKCGSTL